MTDKYIAEIAREYENIKAEAEKLESRKRLLADRLREELGTTSKGTYGPFTITTFEMEKPTVSAKALREEMPEVFAKYGKVTNVPSIRITRAKA